MSNEWNWRHQRNAFPTRNSSSTRERETFYAWKLFCRAFKKKLFVCMKMMKHSNHHDEDEEEKSGKKRLICHDNGLKHFLYSFPTSKFNVMLYLCWRLLLLSSLSLTKLERITWTWIEKKNEIKKYFMSSLSSCELVEWKKKEKILLTQTQKEKLNSSFNRSCWLL